MKFMCVSYTYKHCMADVYVHYNILFIKLCKIIIVIKDVILYYHFISWLIEYFFSQQIKAYYVYFLVSIGCWVWLSTQYSTGSTYSLAMGTEPLLFGLAIMLAWLRAVITMVEGRSLHGSPSNCMGIALRVFSLISLHCISLSPWPPMYKVA